MVRGALNLVPRNEFAKVLTGFFWTSIGLTEWHAVVVQGQLRVHRSDGVDLHLNRCVLGKRLGVNAGLWGVQIFRKRGPKQTNGRVRIFEGRLVDPEGLFEVHVPDRMKQPWPGGQGRGGTGLSSL